MKRLTLGFVIVALAGLATTATAQSTTSVRKDSTPTVIPSTKTVESSSMTAEQQIAASPYAPPIEFQFYRPEDQRGINIFEPLKTEAVPYTGFKFIWGAAFTQQFQGLAHKNTAS